MYSTDDINSSSAVATFLEEKTAWLGPERSQQIGHIWTKYGHNKFLFEGLPLSMMTGCVAALFFNSCTPLPALVFSATHYVTVTTLEQIFPKSTKEDYAAAALMIASGTAIAFTTTELIAKVSLSWPAIVILSVACLSGQVLRGTLRNQGMAPYFPES